MQHTPETITEYLHRHIPLTRHMGARVTALDETSVRMAAPLQPNLNHRETAFGGSIASLGILAAWTLIHVRMIDRGFQGRLVIHKCTAEFSFPIEGDFEAVSACTDNAVWTQFFRGLQRKGKARLQLQSRLLYAGQTAALLDGSFVAFAQPAPSRT